MLSENALTLLKKRYFLPDETWEKLIYRVVSTLNPNRKVQEEYAQLLFNCDFLPNTPTLINAGARTGQLMACFVLPVEDDIQAIFDAIKYAAMIHKSGGGTGFSFSNLREAGAMVNSTNGISSGPVSFMRVFNEATGAIKQGGVRRGANMGMLRIDHPDIREFIACKRDQSQFTNFNISVAITNEFMQAVIEDKEYPLISPLGTITGHEKATDIINLIGQCAHEGGEPGLVFIDRINEMRSHLEMMDATNPCGEQPLLPYEACVLGSINLANMLNVSNEINFEKLERTTTVATLMLNDIINVSRYPLPQIERMVKRYRKIGIGVMGWADMLAKMKAPYKPQDSENNSLEIAASVMSYISGVAKQTSGHLSEHFKIKLGIEENQANSTLTTIAPTGSISIIADCSSGIEPYYSLAYTKNVMDGEKLEYFNSYLQKDLEAADLWNPKIAKAIMKHGSIQAITEIPDDIKERYLTAEELDWKDHLSMQNAFQAFTDNAVSKTINLPKETTVEDIIEIYKAAFFDYKFIKGLTVYRNGSRSGQVLVTGKKEICPECNGKVEHNEGCTSCPSCGWAACEE